jgi:hypothetical protein
MKLIRLRELLLEVQQGLRIYSIRKKQVVIAMTHIIEQNIQRVNIFLKEKKILMVIKL